jgi:hypothetical protein
MAVDLMSSPPVVVDRRSTAELAHRLTRKVPGVAFQDTDTTGSGDFYVA